MSVSDTSNCRFTDWFVKFFREEKCLLHLAIPYSRAYFPILAAYLLSKKLYSRFFFAVLGIDTDLFAASMYEDGTPSSGPLEGDGKNLSVSLSTVLVNQLNRLMF